ncbi:universal stress protein [Sphingomonas sp. PAMC 26621]|uniref:universal stress protein n=1 Tax=Sphingomonas sp. PAMC 26621 TaxID=1112213 RepID=UPI001EE689A8|nr:universal stress protein [Sphingomonas sp. PAMC 26621]
MPFKTMMVHVAASDGNAALLALTAALAAQQDARVIGIAACEPVQIGYVDGDFTGALAVAEQQIVDDTLTAAGVEFRACAALQPYVLEWRAIATLEPIAHVVATAARCADLVITGLSTGALDTSRRADTGELVIHAGRPVLVIPPRAVSAAFETVLVAWNDTPECRRATSDALPFLARADRVILAGVGSDLDAARAQITDVVAWLHRHGIDADIIVTHAPSGNAQALARIAEDHVVDLIVAGAYGHNRLAEWAFGGVTRALLLEGNHCALLAH